MQSPLEQKPTDHHHKLIALLQDPRYRFPRRTFLAAAGAGAIVANFKLSPFGFIVSAAGGVTLNLVAHEDDDLLFLSPDLLHAIQAGRTVRTIYFTAGDAGNAQDYWSSRESGVAAAYAEMVGASNSWNQTDAGISGHPIPLRTLSGHSNISLAFIRLPDGNVDGSGFPSTNHESLMKLWQGTISTIHAIDGSSSYTKASLISTTASLISSFLPDQINTQDYVGTYSDGDHSDHYTTAYVAQAAVQQYITTHGFTGYQGYGIVALPANVTGADLTAKQNAYFSYAPFDVLVCQSVPACSNTGFGEMWLERQYTVGSGSGGGGNQPPVANAGANQTVTPGASVQLDGSGSSDPDGNPLTYRWSQTSGPAVTLSSPTAVQPTFTAPASTTTLIFQLIVNDGQTNSSPASVTITVATSGGGGTNLALTATATASSQNTNTSQTANKAIDGVIDGYPGDYTKEWATQGGGAGSWLKLTWTSPQTVSKLVLYDRPNLDDQITAGTVQFSDGSSISIGPLTNDGSATTYTFAARTITSLQVNITAVKASTQNIGLSEIQVFGS